MNKKEVFNHYSEILDELISNFNFFKTYFHDPFFIDEEVNVEDYKRNMFALMGKPGYEAQREELLKRL